MNFHDHDFSEIAIITSVSDTLHHCRGKCHRVIPGDVILLHPGTVHAYENTANFSVINIIFAASQLPLPHLVGGNLKFFQAMVDTNFVAENPEKPLLHLPEDVLQNTLKLIERMEDEIKSGLPGNRLCVFGLFLAIITQIARTGGAAEQDKFISSAMQALHYLNLHYQQNISVDFLAKLCNMSRSGFFTAFKKLTGYTPIEYQQEKRLALAVKLLRSTRKSLDEVASECGYYDSNYLNKLFTRKFGTSPGKMRKNGW